MQSLLGGADCATGSNPLKQVAHREGVDNSLFRDQFSGPGPSSSSSPFRSSLTRQGPQPQFQGNVPHLNQTPHPFNLSHLSAALADPASNTAGPLVHRPPIGQAIPAHFDQSWGNSPRASPQPQQRLGSIQSRGSPSPFATEFQNGQTGRSEWAENFGSPDGAMIKGKGRAFSPVEQQQYQGSPSYGQQSGGSGYAHGCGSGQNYRMPYQPTFQPMYSGYQQQPQQQFPINSNGQMEQMSGQMNGRTEQEAKEMEAAFEQALSDAQAQAEKEAAAQKIDQELHKTQADNIWLSRHAQMENRYAQEDKTKQAEQEAKEMQKDAVEEGIEDRGEAKGEFDKVWESLRPEAERLEKLAEWEKDFSQFTNDQDDLFDTLNSSLNRPDVGQSSLAQQMDFGIGPGYSNNLADQFVPPVQNNGLPVRKEYDFSFPNKFDSLDPQAVWAEANHLLASGGSLTDASLLLESYLRRATSEHFQRPGQSEVEAWSLLGQTHAMDEKEEKALAAFEEGREVLKNGASAPVVGEMLTNLAISYVNESYDLAALQVLYQYLMLSHPTHAGNQPTQQRMQEESNPWAMHKEMTDMFLNVAKEQYERNGQVDPDLQVGLGTLYYMQGDYDEARDCWVAALGERPSDYLLWNRLGATLANSGNPEEAVDAYRRALELKPTFTRAIFNLGVACLNIGVHREAAEHFLAALSLHARSENPDKDMLGMGGEGGNDSSVLWMTLRRALTALEMTDLAERARPGTDLGLFRQAGFEF